MADEKGVAIHSWGPHPIHTVTDLVDPDAPKCVACHRYHGGVNEGTLCLEREVRRLRDYIGSLQRNAALQKVQP